MGEKDRRLERTRSTARKAGAPTKSEPSRIEEPESDGESDADLVSSDHVRVVIRCRPLNPAKERDGRGTIRLDTQTNTVELRQEGSTPKTYRFSFVADDRRDNAFIFLRTGRPIVECALAGFNGAIVAYGQTGSGKTFTMQGTSLLGSSQRDGGTKGLTQSVCETLFEQVRELTTGSDSVTVSITASYLEIYNEVLLDLLLAPESGGGVGGSNRTPQKAPKLTIREDSNGQIFVNGLSQVAVATPDECYQLLVRGAERRTVGATNMNAESSRSHSVFTLMLEKKDNAKGTVRASRLHLVDLAGSERQRGTGATGVRLREAGGINKSLSALGNVINALSAREPGAAGQFGGSRGRMPSCRDSKLTFLLKDALGGNAKLCLIATISPAAESVDETVSTLEFARRCAAVRNEAVVNESLTEDVAQLQAEVRRLKEEVATLKQRLAEARAGGGEAQLVRHRCSGSSSAAGTPSAAAEKAREDGAHTKQEGVSPTSRTKSGQYGQPATQTSGATEEGGETGRVGERTVLSGPTGVNGGTEHSRSTHDVMMTREGEVAMGRDGVSTRGDTSWVRGKAMGTDGGAGLEGSPTRVLDFGEAEVGAGLATQGRKQSTVSRGVAAWECGGVVVAGDPVSDDEGENGSSRDGERGDGGADEGSVLLRELREGLTELNRCADELLSAMGAC